MRRTQVSANDMHRINNKKTFEPRQWIIWIPVCVTTALRQQTTLVIVH